MGALSVQQVTKRYGANHILKSVDLEITEGEFVILVGPSGCGKSTLLSMIAGLDSPTSGRILLGGRDITQVAPKDRDIAMVFQSYALYPNMTVAQNISFALEMRKVPRAERQRLIDKVSKMLQLDHLLDRKPGQLSGGQRQRVAMGRALVRQPAAFLFDEPLSNLDAKLRVQMRLAIKAMQRKVETTSLYVTHDQVEAMTLADRLVVMNAGHAEQIDTPLNVYREPATTFVAGFIGSPAMNLMAAAVAANGKGLVLDGSGTVKPRDIVLPESGRKVLIGIRPEHLSPVADLNADLHLAVQAVETLGADTLAHGRLADGGAGSEMVARLPGTSAVKAGEVLPLAIEPGMTHLFDRESGRRIV